MMFRILAFLLLPVICLAQVNSNGEKPTGELLSNEISPNDMKRNASFNLDEIKVRWKKAALENCTGVPCVVTPPPPPPLETKETFAFPFASVPTVTVIEDVLTKFKFEELTCDPPFDVTRSVDVGPCGPCGPVVT